MLKRGPAKDNTVAWLTKAIEQASQSAQFCTAGCLEPIDPGLIVNAVGPCRLPLGPKTRKALLARCQVAPYGKGTKTLVDPSVRNTLELNPEQFQLSAAWQAAIVKLTQHIAPQLGLPAERLEPRLYKLLAYEKGGFFLPHRDSEKHDRMVASLIVVLPQEFGGGELNVSHRDESKVFAFAEAAVGKAPCYAAFYADCEHSVRRVTRGVRLCLAYNLVLKPAPRSSNAPAFPDDPVAVAIRSWVTAKPGNPLVFALDHQYTQKGLALDLLKGADRQLADRLVAAAEQANCVVHLSQVARHTLQHADDGSYGRDYYGRRRYGRDDDDDDYDDPDNGSGEYVLGEMYEEELNGSEWTKLDGQRLAWGTINFSPSDIVSRVPLDKWQPTTEEYEGYTGNAGNTLDRWYHRSALVVWSRDHHFDVLARSGLSNVIPMFTAMVVKLAKTPAKRLAAARSEAIAFARGIIAHWYTRHNSNYSSTSDSNSLAEFPKVLLLLHDQETVARYLAALADRDRAQPLDTFVPAVCREFGWTAFAPELEALLAAPTEDTGWQRHHRAELAVRDAQWLAAYCGADLAEPQPERTALAATLCALAVKRFCEVVPAPHVVYREGSTTAQALPWLLKALAAGRRNDDLKQVIAFVEAAPHAFPRNECQVPCLKTLIPWAQAQLGSVPAPLSAWLASVRRQLEAATARAPTKPTDWARPACVTCNCNLCGEVNAFLADRSAEVGRIRAVESERYHLTSQIARYQCDVKHTLERSGRPYALVMTKTLGSYERAVKLFKVESQLLSALPPAPRSGN